MTKVLHINDYPLDAGGGGAEVVMRTTIALLRERGLHVESFTGADLADARRTPLRYINNAHARQALRARLDAFRPDVVHLHNFYHVLSPGILATLADYKRAYPLRVVMTAHDYHLICPNSGGSWFHWWTGEREVIGASAPGYWSRRWDQRSVLHSCLKLAQHTWNYRWHHRQRVIDLVICPSRFVQEILMPTDLNTTWLPHPIPTVSSFGSGVREAEELRFVFAGRLEPEKGLNELLRLWPSDFAPTFTIIGDGAELAACRATCAARGWSRRVEFTGRLSHAETLARIAGCHVLVQPSRVLETYGLTLIEALAQGTNILAANRGAASEIVEAAGVGFLYEPDQAASLASRIEEIRQRHEAGTLNRFAVGMLLADRSEARYVDQLLQLYGIAQARPLAA